MGEVRTYGGKTAFPAAGAKARLARWAGRCDQPLRDLLGPVYLRHGKRLPHDRPGAAPGGRQARKKTGAARGQQQILPAGAIGRRKRLPAAAAKKGGDRILCPLPFPVGSEEVPLSCSLRRVSPAGEDRYSSAGDRPVWPCFPDSTNGAAPYAGDPSSRGRYISYQGTPPWTEAAMPRFLKPKLS